MPGRPDRARQQRCAGASHLLGWRRADRMAAAAAGSRWRAADGRRDALDDGAGDDEPRCQHESRSDQLQPFQRKRVVGRRASDGGARVVCSAARFRRRDARLASDDHRGRRSSARPRDVEPQRRCQRQRRLEQSDRPRQRTRRTAGWLAHDQELRRDRARLADVRRHHRRGELPGHRRFGVRGDRRAESDVVRHRDRQEQRISCEQSADVRVVRSGRGSDHHIERDDVHCKTFPGQSHRRRAPDLRRYEPLADRWRHATSRATYSLARGPRSI